MAVGVEADRCEVLLCVANARHGSDAHRDRSLRDDTRHDHLATAGAAVEYFRVQELTIPKNASLQARHLTDLRLLADAVAALVDGSTRPNRALLQLLGRTRYAYDAAGAITPVETGWNGLVATLIPAFFELERHRRALRRCRNPRCRWLFLDTSPGHRRLWCDMTTCGSRTKMRRYRRRLRRTRTR